MCSLDSPLIAWYLPKWRLTQKSKVRTRRYEWSSSQAMYHDMITNDKLKPKFLHHDFIIIRLLDKRTRLLFLTGYIIVCSEVLSHLHYYFLPINILFILWTSHHNYTSAPFNHSVITYSIGRDVYWSNRLYRAIGQSVHKTRSGVASSWNPRRFKWFNSLIRRLSSNTNPLCW